ncbi:NAD(P)-dependent glycerol-3-phosphate dehydrogenase [Horticoccus luteus]|uniref:Glycerol-3-phosphate dehydrogenase [NAD(P)+] n=1 Tax=Horticoccus luteus TaxID=2862869 RepID=A0A8F9XK35_9BACT|nr:NAD(P)H-dependent glycerol-3-phosphate dehydrogenase [Horticoccus luteus]QYM79298.1 NAD(P)-dependent glycerol-3-phosphate dehydrogenase [Horticoccus luteus]
MKFVVLGAGAWGTAFALHLARADQDVTLVPRRKEHAALLQAERENREYLPGIALPGTLAVTGEADAVVGGAEVVLLACPAQALRDTCSALRTRLGGARVRLVASLAKGLELRTHLRPSEVIASVLPGCATGSVTGPTNAAEVARGLPAALVLATAAVDEFANEVQAAMSGPTLRVYTSDDVAGAEFGGCLKNVYAIAAGCCEGLRLGDNAKAALMTRALAEMVRVGVALGARAETFYGLSGFGDLVATCHGGWSRNREFGQRVGEGRAVAELMAHRKTVVEGYKTTAALDELCRERGLEAPILREMHAILFEGKQPAEALRALMLRELKRETASPLPT